ncbi:MAG TPA: hypothetical protein VKA85_06305 [Candidatus Limnocylindrales bacterium]|nr:hypothetical protein [Candidatus Limnocylindrales bacterium]
MHRVSYFEVAARYDERLRQADRIRRSADFRRPNRIASLLAAIGLRPLVFRPAI